LPYALLALISDGFGLSRRVITDVPVRVAAYCVQVVVLSVQIVALSVRYFALCVRYFVLRTVLRPFESGRVYERYEENFVRRQRDYWRRRWAVLGNEGLRRGHPMRLTPATSLRDTSRISTRDASRARPRARARRRARRLGLARPEDPEPPLDRDADAAA
jgi:hypothetical protein